MAVNGKAASPTTRIKLTIPYALVTRHGANQQVMRSILDDAFKVALGRCDWKCDIVITCTVEQFGVFCYLMTTHRLTSAMSMIDVWMFQPDGVPPCVFDAADNGSKRLNIPKMPAPVATASEVS